MKRTDEEKKQRAEDIVFGSLQNYGNLKVWRAMVGCNFYDVAGNLFHVSVIPMDDKWFERNHDGEESLYEEK